MNTKLYTGNGGTQSITGVGFQSDWSWFKKRNSAADSSLIDAVRGVRKSLTSNNAEAEYTESAGLSAFNSDGFSFDGTGYDHVNTNGDTFASWNWKANGAGSANTVGSVNSTVSVNTTSGFSIVKWTGTGANATVGHGLGAVPKMIICKNTDTAVNWIVYHNKLDASSPQNKYIELNRTTGVQDYPMWNDTAPTSSVFSVGSDVATNKSGSPIIAYCFSNVQGFSKIGSYTGNGNADGTFVYTGFKPSFILAKRTDATAGWVLFDNKRIGYNGSGNYWLDAQNNEADQTDATGMFDQLSNGFKIRSSFGSRNASGGNYIYMAFAEAPLVGSNNVPCTAR